MESIFGVGSISREDERFIPDFKSHKEAKVWFLNRFGKRFMKGSVEKVHNQKCYFYILIVNEKAFKYGLKAFQHKGIIDSTNYMTSYQEIQIFEDGSVHIVHQEEF
ncbi:hypothetical protein LG296_20340 (plasmid) [Ureibacillus chungkukjangi]|uniref:hypothetical protein n=1 Tax=Ureibacillus chungkukjangi TaxID=1202712 RepID=UPI0020422587|nr:hypothetical protein [Ureibacillus chungkukjangi]MCM3389347.1 hypothetical protein [Ureibacillus chungkukjangi]MDI7743482.1 hypothetical protein [Lysinibacillus fusiformis]